MASLLLAERRVCVAPRPFFCLGTAIVNLSYPLSNARRESDGLAVYKQYVMLAQGIVRATYKHNDSRVHVARNVPKRPDP